MSAVKELVKQDQDLDYSRIVLDFSGVIDLTDHQLLELCARNRELQIERNREGKLIIMSPTFSESGEREASITTEVGIWNKKYKLWKVFSSSAGFTLPNGAMRSPDTSFIPIEKWKAIPLSKRQEFAPICPDFIVELRSKSDRLKNLKEKMDEWMENGCRLAWLIDPIEEKAYIYRPNQEVEVIDSFDRKLYGEEVLPEFELELSE